ncbi:MAG: hypothetical protein IPK81_11555 [Rhodospirillales bacterium]|nr:MAG: hypothetical protein IPK81_11555 [Rhodospirillales bacterium]
MTGAPLFVPLRRPKRIWAVAAVHGAAARLRALGRMVGERAAAGDALVFLGDVIGGPPGGEAREAGIDSGAALDAALALRRQILALPGARACDVAYLRGAQEEMWSKLSELQFAPAPRDILRWMAHRGVAATLETYGGADALDEGARACREGPMAIARWTSTLRQEVRARPGHADAMAAIRRAALTEDRKVLLVNHGLDATRTLERQGDAFWWGGPAPFETILQPYGPVRRVVRGRAAGHPGVVERPHTLTLDAGCGFGGPLLCGLLDGDGAVLDVLRA